MYVWNLLLGVVCCVVLRVVHSIPRNDTVNNEIPESYLKLAEGNSLWYNLLHNCKNNSLSCVKQTAYNYLSDLLEYSDNLEVTSNILLEKNDIDFNTISEASAESEEEQESSRSSPLEEVSSALHDKAVKFLMTHDLVLRLPEYFFDGASLKISPRTFDTDGAMVKLNTFPGKGRIFFKKIKKFISNKLIIALLAILLVIKLLAVKFLFFMPMIMGAAAAKKLLLKVLLFLFPALAHLFKLCPYYAPTKYHHHQHHISHIHHLSHLPGVHHTVELDHPPPGHGHDDHQLDYYSEGPGVAGHDFHRKDDLKAQKLGDEYGGSFGGQGQASYKRGTKLPPSSKRPLTPAEIENMILKAEKEATLKARLQEEQKRVQSDNKRIQENIKQLLKVQEKLRVQQALLAHTSKLATANILHANVIPAQSLTPPGNAISASHIVQSPLTQPAIIQALPVYEATFKQNVQQTTPPPSFDPFYSPILEKIDKILVDIDYTEEPCRERLICSMYKNPPKFSPHSNLLSAELSRDDLEKPTTSNAAIIRFYRYVQAARDGQDKRDCLRLYPACIINTEA